VLETCVRGGFSTIAIARDAIVSLGWKSKQAVLNRLAAMPSCLGHKIKFICGDVFSAEINEALPNIDALYKAQYMSFDFSNPIQSLLRTHC
jgi:hypothetical protein